MTAEEIEEIKKKLEAENLQEGWRVKVTRVFIDHPVVGSYPPPSFLRVNNGI
jgi:hypothetical protein